MEKVPFSAYDFFGYVAPGMVVVVGLEWTIGYPHPLSQDLKPFSLAVLVLAVYVAGHLAAGLAKGLLEDWFVKRVLGNPSFALLASQEASPRFASLFRAYFVPLPLGVQARIRERAAQAGAEEIGEPLFLHVRYHEQTLKNERLMKKLDTFVGLYGFARNMAFTCLLVALGILTKLAAGYGAPKDATRAALLLIAGLLLLYRYLKFHRQYSFELFNHFASCREPAPCEPKSTS